MIDDLKTPVSPAVLVAPERRVAKSPPGAVERRPLRRRMLVAGPAVAVVTMAAALIATREAGLPLRDPDHVAGRRLLLVFALVALLVVGDILVRAGKRSGARWPSRAAVHSVWRERWTLRRGVAVFS